MALQLTDSKIWDCNSGEALHTFAHNHIVRSVALNPQQTPQYLLTVSYSDCHMCKHAYGRAETRRKSDCSISVGQTLNRLSSVPTPTGCLVMAQSVLSSGTRDLAGPLESVPRKMVSSGGSPRISSAAKLTTGGGICAHCPRPRVST